jgi:hypothetical protein
MLLFSFSVIEQKEKNKENVDSEYEERKNKYKIMDK